MPTSYLSKTSKDQFDQPSTSRVSPIFSSSQIMQSRPSSSEWLRQITEMPENPPTRRSTKITTKPIRKLKNTIRHQTTLLKNKRSYIAKLNKTVLSLKQQLTHRTIENVINTTNFPSIAPKTLVGMQVLRSNKKWSPWTKEERDFALLTFYKSPSAYKFLRNNQKIRLPSISSIKKWIGNSKCKPGFSPRFFSQLKRKVSVMTPDERYCIIAFDEMKIKKCVEYNKRLDLVEGYEDLEPYGRTDKLGSQVLVSREGCLLELENANLLFRYRFLSRIQDIKNNNSKNVRTNIYHQLNSARDSV